MTYLVTSGLFTCATALIWGVNTLFLLDAGLDIFQVMLVNGIYSVGQAVFEVPTGVIADTVGRKASFVFGIATLIVSTLLYLASAAYGWGVLGFALGSLLLGLGWTFQTGAVDAWLVDALHATGYGGRIDVVFSRGGVVFGVAMLLGTVAGGFLGQIDLTVPYLARSALLGLALVATMALMKDIGFERRRLRLSRLGAEMRGIAEAGVTHGWRNGVVRPLLLVSAVQGTFMMYFFYASQPYALDLLGRPDLIWVAGALTAMFGLATVIGNLCVGSFTRSRWGASAPRVLAVGAAVFTVLVAGAGIVGIVAPDGGSMVAFAAVAALMFAIGVSMGLIGPIRQGYINAHIPSAQRATVLSLDSFFADAGGAMGQPSFGWLSRVVSIPAAWVLGAVITSASVPLYVRSGRAAETCVDGEGTPTCVSARVRESIEPLEI